MLRRREIETHRLRRVRVAEAQWVHVVAIRPTHLPRAVVVHRVAKLRGRVGRVDRTGWPSQSSRRRRVARWLGSDTSDAMTSARQLTDTSVLYHSPNPFVRRRRLGSCNASRVLPRAASPRLRRVRLVRARSDTCLLYTSDA